MKTQMEMNWSKYLGIFTEQNRNRPTRLGVFEGHAGSMSDLWLEDGLPLASVEVTGRTGKFDVEITLDDGPGPEAAHMSHRVADARTLRIVLGVSGDSEGLDIENADGVTTVLRFEEQGPKE